MSLQHRDPPVIRTREESSGIELLLAKHSKTLVITTGCVFSLIVAGYLARGHPIVTVLFSLLSGFAPLVGLLVLFIIIAFLISLLIIKAEQTLADEDDAMVYAPHRKSKWRQTAPSLSDLLADRLSLKEHSPPAFHIP